MKYLKHTRRGLENIMNKNLVFRKLLKVFLKQIITDEFVQGVRNHFVLRKLVHKTWVQ